MNEKLSLTPGDEQIFQNFFEYVTIYSWQVSFPKSFFCLFLLSNNY